MQPVQIDINSTDLNVRGFVRKLFAGRTVAIATMHGKETIIQPIIQKFLPVSVTIPSSLNTDQFGTFTGEIERASPLAALRAKARAASMLTSSAIAIASEGSFGSHPLYPFVGVNEELVMLMDLQRGWEIIGHYMTSDTNYNTITAANWEQLHEFAIASLFPSHGLLLKSASGEIVRDIDGWENLNKIFNEYLSGGPVLAMTDMRAMRNPTRLHAIKCATEDLVRNIFSVCPGCMLPGLSRYQSVPGLCCAQCGIPTRNIKGFLLRCTACTYLTFQPEVDPELADPRFCDNCNP